MVTILRVVAHTGFFRADKNINKKSVWFFPLGSLGHSGLRILQAPTPLGSCFVCHVVGYVVAAFFSVCVCVCVCACVRACVCVCVRND